MEQEADVSSVASGSVPHERNVNEDDEAMNPVQSRGVGNVGTEPVGESNMKEGQNESLSKEQEAGLEGVEEDLDTGSMVNLVGTEPVELSIGKGKEKRERTAASTTSPSKRSRRGRSKGPGNQKQKGASSDTNPSIQWPTSTGANEELVNVRRMMKDAETRTRAKAGKR